MTNIECCGNKAAYDKNDNKKCTKNILGLKLP